MKDYTISVIKLTDETLMRKACETTFLGFSNQKLLSIYKSEHSPARTQMFWITLKNIPLFISTHLLRHHVGSVPFQLTCREDRRGGNPNFQGTIDCINRSLNNAASSDDLNEIKSTILQSTSHLEELKDRADRYTPVNLSLLINAQSLIDMAKLRLCAQAHRETREVFQSLKDEVAKVDPDLAKMMVRKCVYRGGLCGEPRSCGFNDTPGFLKELSEYSQSFSSKQLGFSSFTINQLISK